MMSIYLEILFGANNLSKPETINYFINKYTKQWIDIFISDIINNLIYDGLLIKNNIGLISITERGKFICNTIINFTTNILLREK